MYDKNRKKMGCRRIGRNKSVVSLAEAIILQTMEDIWDARYMTESIHFFKSEEFSLCADMAGLTALGQIRLLNMLRKFYMPENNFGKGILTKNEKSYPSC
jgi:hypothetical protein